MIHWLPPTAGPVLPSHEIHVWRASLDLPNPDRRALEALLVPEEVARAGRFARARDRDRFVVARGTLRALLARYLYLPPQELCFQLGPQGKPSLAGPSLDVRFNLSHSGDLAVYAIALQREVGIDIERIVLNAEIARSALQFFSTQERQALESLPLDARTAAFFAVWTRKEAYIKGTGMGLSTPLSDFTVSCGPNDAALLDDGQGAGADARWWLQDLSPAPGYAGALAVEGHLDSQAQVRYLQV